MADQEMKLHVAYCAGWGLSEADMAAEPEAQATMAYTRYVLEKGLAGDLLDLQVALAPLRRRLRRNRRTAYRRPHHGDGRQPLWRLDQDVRIR